jgi:3-hydroxyacyl-CoA dehydrogenase
VLYILEQGLASPSWIDSTVTGRVARVGPCETIDAIGIPLFTDLLRHTLATFAADQAVPELCHRLIRDGRFGKYASQGVFIYRNDRPVDDVPEYYLNREQTHTPASVRSDEMGLHERLVFPIYFSLLRVAQEGLGDLADLCVALSDIAGLKLDPMEEMRKLGSEGLRDVFDRLRDELGPRFDCRPLHGIMATLDNR